MNPTPTVIQNLTGAKEIISGSLFVYAIMNDGTVKSWGWNKSGELGLGTCDYDKHPIPTLIPGLIIN